MGSVLEQLLDPYKVSGLQPGPSNITPLSSVAASSARGRPHPPAYSPDNPFFWFGILAAVTLGFAGVATSVKVGPFKAAASAGDTK